MFDEEIMKRAREEEAAILRTRGKHMCNLSTDYGYSDDMSQLERIKCAIKGVKRDGLEPVYVYYDRWSIIVYRQRDLRLFEMLYPKKEHMMEEMLSKKELQDLLKDLGISKETYVENAKREIDKMVKRGVKGYALMTQEDKDKRQNEKRDLEKKQRDLEKQQKRKEFNEWFFVKFTKFCELTFKILQFFGLFCAIIFFCVAIYILKFKMNLGNSEDL